MFHFLLFLFVFIIIQIFPKSLMSPHPLTYIVVMLCFYLTRT
nr:MAG TPA: hypothetical protein [Caudoviricetes sp.]